MFQKELFEKLKPVYGDFIDKLWVSYIAGDRVQKQEIEQLLELLALKRLGLDYEKHTILLPPPTQEQAAGDYYLGHVQYAGKSLYPFGLREEEWIQHTAIFGRTGAGKTNLVFLIIWNLLKMGKPFLIFDWKRNYRDILPQLNAEKVIIFTVGRNISPFKFNPLIPPKGTPIKVWIKKLIEILAHAYFIGEGVMHLLQESLDHVYRSKGAFNSDNPTYPIFEDVQLFLQSYPVRGRKALWMDSALRVLSSVTYGGMGDIINTRQNIGIADLLDKNVILELDGLGNSDKTFLIESLLLWVYHFRLTSGEREKFKHAFIIEEAHHILHKNNQNFSSNELVTDIILREIRELGEAIILIDQHPSLISLPALGNSYSTISFNLKHQYDVQAMASAILLDQKEILGLLPIGHAIAKLQSRYMKPFLVRIPLSKIEKGSVNDTMIKEHMKGFSAERELFCTEQHKSEQVQVIPMKAKIIIEEPEQALLTDILNNPLSSIRGRYQQLGLSSYRGNKAQNRLIDLQLVKAVDILTRKGRIKLFDLTSGGLSYLAPKTMKTRKSEGVEHLYWKHSIADFFRKQGFEVEIEKAVHGSIIDVVAKNENTSIAIEVETGKSDYMQNIKCALAHDFDRITVAVLNRELGKKIKKKIIEQKLETKKLFVIMAKDFV